MSSFHCPHCGTPIIDTPRGYVTECEHYPLERSKPAGSTADSAWHPFLTKIPAEAEAEWKMRGHKPERRIG